MVTMAYSLGARRRVFAVSANYATGAPNGAAITDSHGTVWRATGGNQISVNGVTDTTTSGVAKIFYVAGKIWQVAPSGWYFKTFPSDAWTFSSTTGLISASMTTINVGDTTSGIVDVRNYVWTLTAAGVIVLDGTADPVTHDVTQLVYYNNQIWQNTIFGWYFKTLPTDTWTQSANAPGTGPVTGNRTTILGAQLGNPDGGIDQGMRDNFNSFSSGMGEAPTMWTTYAVPDYGDSNFWTDMDGSAGSSAGGMHNLNGMTGAQFPFPAQFSIPMVGIAMCKPGSADSDFAAIQRGDHDADFTAIWDTYVQSGFPYLIIRPGWEMNGDWEPWSRPKGAWDTAFYNSWKATFQRIIQNARDYAASKTGVTIESCWNPGYMYPGGYADYTQLYPGDAWVDHIGIDTYGAYAEGGGAPDNGPLFNSPAGDNTYFSLKDAIALCIAHGKPLCFPEMGCSPGHLSFPQNIQSVVTGSPACKVSFVALWNKTDGNGSNTYWSVDAPTAAAWKACFQAIRATNSPW